MEEPFMGCPAFHIVKCLLQALPWEGPRLAVAQQQQQQVGSRADRYLAGFGAVYVPKVCLMATATSFDGGARARSRAGGSGFDGGARRARISASSSSVPRGCGTGRDPRATGPEEEAARGGMKARRQAQAQVDGGKWKATSRLLA